MRLVRTRSPQQPRTTMNVTRRPKLNFAAHAAYLAMLGLLVLPFHVTGEQPSDEQALQGKWVCVDATKNGKKVADYLGVRIVINGDKLTWFFPQKDGSYREQKGEFKIDSAKKFFDWWKLDEPAKVDQRLYTLTGAMLRWSTNLDWKTRPETFDAGIWQFAMKRITRTDEAIGIAKLLVA